MKVYFDASVIIAGLLSQAGGSARLLKSIELNIITGVVSQNVIDEVIGKARKIKRDEDEIKRFIRAAGMLIHKTIVEEEIMKYRNFVDKEDAHLIAGAKLTNCKYLVTLDKKHLLRADIQKKFLPLRILSPKELLEIILL